VSAGDTPTQPILIRSWGLTSPPVAPAPVPARTHVGVEVDILEPPSSWAHVAAFIVCAFAISVVIASFAVALATGLL
jgi:hypothetical protein